MESATDLGTDEKILLNLIQTTNLPVYRYAYSDRIAWLMALMSDLAYEPFEKINNDNVVRELLEQSYNLIEENDQNHSPDAEKKLYTHLENLRQDIEKQETSSDTAKNIVSELNNSGINIEKKYDVDDTQAFLATTKKFLILAFRGTENNIASLRTDFDAAQINCPSGGKVHKGFNDAFESVHRQIQNDLYSKKFTDFPIFITGHSRGGALAIIATKRLKHQAGIAPCYTFGAPRVGDEKWSNMIKTRVFRIVNVADSVTFLPPSGHTIKFLQQLVKIIPKYGHGLVNFLNNYAGYFHSGDIRYLTNSPEGNYQDAKLTYTMTLPERIQTLYQNTSPWISPIANHSSTIYRKKLAIIAKNRTPELF